MTDTGNIVNLPKGEPAGEARWADSFVNLLAGLGVVGRDKFASQEYTFSKMTVLELENAYRGDWLARKAVAIPAWDMTREWRSWQADPDQIKLLEEAERKLFMQQRVQNALLKARLYGGAVIVIGVDAGAPEEELDLETVKQDSLKFLHVVSKNQISTGPIVYDITSKYYGQPEYYEARNQPASKDFSQADKPPKAYGGNNVRLHPSRVVKLIGSDTADQLLTDTWGDSVLQAVNDAIKAAGLVNGSLATLCSELKIDVIKIPELKSILSTADGTRKMLARFSAANVAKSTVNTILIDGNEEWQRIQATLAGVPEIIATYLQTVAGAVDIPAGRFLGLPHRGLNVTGEADFRNYYDHLASEQSVTLQPAMSVLDEVLIRSALGDRPETIFYEWDSLWQLSDGDKADIGLKKAQAYQIDVNAAQLPPAALANGRANQLIEDGTYPGLEQALEDCAAEGDTIEEQNAPQPMPMGVDPMTGEPMDPNAPPGKGGSVLPFPPKKPKVGQTGQLPFGRRSTAPGMRGSGDGVDAEADHDDGPFGDENECHDPHTGEFCGPGGGTGTGSAEGVPVHHEVFEPTGETGSKGHPGEGYSKNAYVDSNGVIQTTKVEDAQRALYENRRVNLDQPRKVSTLIKRLGEDVKAAVARGEQAPNLNMCNVSVSGTNLFCGQSRGIPRVKMPQLDDDQTKALIRDLKSRGIGVTKEKWPASHLKATQDELSGVKVWQQVEKAKIDPSRLEKRLVVSRDGYILDGHHHWAAKIGIDAKDNKLTGKMRVSRVDANITELLEHAKRHSGPPKSVTQEVKVTFKKKRDGFGDGLLDDELFGELFPEAKDSNECHDPNTGEFCGGGGGAAGPKEAEQVRTASDLEKFSDPSLPPDGAGSHYFYHSPRYRSELESIAKDGLRPGSYLSKDEIRDRGAGYVIVRADTPPPESKDVVEVGLTYRQWRTTENIPAGNVVRVVRSVPTGAGGHSIREDELAQHALHNQGSTDPEVRALPEKYRKWYGLAARRRDSNECHEPGGPTGGQFCSEPGAGGGAASEGKGKGKVEVDSVSKFRADKVGVSPGNDKELLAAWNKTVGMEPAEFKKSFLGGANGEMTVRAKGYGLGKDREVYIEIKGKLKDENGNTVGSYTREIDTSKNTAESSLLEIDKAAQSHGIAKNLLAGNVETYRRIGLKHVDVHANIDVGGYAWAKYGYVPNQGSWNQLQGMISRRIAKSPSEVQAAFRAELGGVLKSKDPKSIWVVADNPRFGKQILLGSDWHGKLSFKDEESMKRFNAYVGRKSGGSKHRDSGTDPARTPRSPPPASKEFYYIDDDGIAQDASLHDEILDGGDDAAAKQVSAAVKARLGDSNECHDPNTGEFCSEGGPGGAALRPTPAMGTTIYRGGGHGEFSASWEGQGVYVALEHGPAAQWGEVKQHVLSRTPRLVDLNNWNGPGSKQLVMAAAKDADLPPRVGGLDKPTYESGAAEVFIKMDEDGVAYLHKHGYDGVRFGNEVFLRGGLSGWARK